MAVAALLFRGLHRECWRLSALTADSGEVAPPPMLLNGSGERVRPLRLAGRCGRTMWRYDFGLQLGSMERTAEYEIAGRRWCVHLPSIGGPLRIAFTACNGFEAERTGVFDHKRNELWRRLGAEHAHAPFHLLLHGGDQLYADSLWEEVPALAAWRRLRAPRRVAAPFTPEMAEALSNYYFTRYCWLWEQPELDPLLGSIPSLMMWDDHDIFDGWGSHDPEWQSCPVFQGTYAVAREHFALFQLAALPHDLPRDGFSDPFGRQFGWGHRVLHEIGIIAPDLRAERSRCRVMGDDSWRAFKTMLEGMADCRHVLLISSVPLLNAAEPLLERLFEALPGHQPFQLDLRDQWRSIWHRDEWLRLLRHLLAFAGRTGAAVTVLSGEIHLGAFAMAEREGVTIYQLTSSGIVHPPPPAWIVALMDWMSTGPAEEIEPGLELKLLTIPGHRKRFLGARNWLALEVSPTAGFAATWHTTSSSFNVRSSSSCGQ